MIYRFCFRICIVDNQSFLMIFRNLRKSLIYHLCKCCLSIVKVCDIQIFKLTSSITLLYSIIIFSFIFFFIPVCEYSRFLFLFVSIHSIESKNIYCLFILPFYLCILGNFVENCNNYPSIKYGYGMK